MERSQNSGTSPHFSRLLSDSQKKSLNKDGRLDEARWLFKKISTKKQAWVIKKINNTPDMSADEIIALIQSKIKLPKEASNWTVSEAWKLTWLTSSRVFRVFKNWK